MEQIFVDLGDFLGETYEIAFRINGHAYRVTFGEANVDEVLRIIWGDQEQAKDSVLLARRIVEGFLPDHLAEGDPATLRDDLKLLPFINLKDPEGLSIQKLEMMLRTRIKKNETGANPTATAAPSGSPETSPS